MPGQRGTENRQMEKVVTFRVSAELYGRMNAAAANTNLSLNAWLREVVANTVARVDLAGPRSAPRPRVTKMPDNVIRQLAATGDLLADLEGGLRELLNAPPGFNGQALPGDHDHHEKLRWAIAVVRNLSEAVVSATLELKSS